MNTIFRRSVGDVGAPTRTFKEYMRCSISRSPSLALALVLLLIALAIPGTAVAQEWDLGPTPAVSIECLFESPASGSLTTDPAIDGSWLQFRRDRKLTGRSPLIGDITCPQLLWSIDLGARTNWFSIRPGSGPSTLDLPVEGEFGDRWTTGQQLFALDGVTIDLNGDGSELIDPVGRGVFLVGDLIPAVTGFERIICSPEWGAVENRCYLHNWVNGAWQEVWHSDLSYFESNHGARPIVGDFDNDGVVEAVVSPWYQIHMLDLETGVLEQSGEFLEPPEFGIEDAPTGRAYGWFGAVDVEGDPRDEFIILGDHEHFVAVIGWVNDELTLLWDHRFETNIYQLYTRHQNLPNPVADVDGDGVPEIVTSVFNESGDEKWHVLVFDGATGAIKLDLTESYLSGLGDLDGDQIAELFITETTGHGIPKYADTYVLSFDAQIQTVLWTGTGEGFELYQSPGYGDKVNAGMVYERRNIFMRDDWNSQMVFATRSQGAAEGDVTLRFYEMSNDVISETASLTGPRLQILSLPHTAPERGILVQSITENASEGPVSMTNIASTLEVYGRTHPFEASFLSPSAGTFLTSSAVARLDPTGPVAVVTQDYSEQIRAFDVASGGSPTELWREAGRGFTSGEYPRQIASTAEFRSVVLADVDGGGDIEVVMADQTPGGDGLIKAIDADGVIVWATQLPAAGAPPIWREGGITHWVAGHFRSAAQEDVLVSVRRQLGHNHQLHLLDGQTGQLVWTSTNGGTPGCTTWPVVGAGNGIMPIVDWDNDGLDEAVNIGSTVFSVYDGSDGSLLTTRPIFPQDACPERDPIRGLEADAAPILPIADFGNTGTEQLLFGKHQSALGVLELNGDPAWVTPPFAGMPDNTLQGIADLDGNGDLEIIVVGHCTTPGEEVRVYNGATGTLRWTMAMPSACQGPGTKALSSGDLDGDGKEEVYFTQIHDLYALAEIGGIGTILWRANFSAVGDEYSTPVIADVDGSGRPQILINSPDAYLYALGAPPPPFTDIVGLIDINSNGSSDVAVIVQGGSSHVHIRDGSTDALITDIDFGDDPMTAMAVIDDISSNGMPEIAMLGTRPDGSVRVQVKDSDSGLTVKNVFYGSTFSAVNMTVLPDTDGNSADELLVVGANSSGGVRAQARDALSGAATSTTFYGGNVPPQDVVTIPDVSGNGEPEVLMHGRVTASGQGRVQMRDSATKALLGNFFFGTAYVPIGLVTIDDVSGDGVPDLAQLGRRDDTGAVRIQVKQSDTGVTVSNAFTGDVDMPIVLLGIGDANGNTSPDIAMLVRRPDGTAKVVVRDGATGAFIRNIFAGAVSNPVAMTLVDDLDLSGEPELAILGDDSAGMPRVQIKDLISGAQVNTIDFP